MNFLGKRVACTIGIISSLVFSYCIFCVELVLLTKLFFVFFVLCHDSISWFPQCWLLQILPNFSLSQCFLLFTVCNPTLISYCISWEISLILRCPGLPNWQEGCFGASYSFTQSNKLWILSFFPPVLSTSYISVWGDQKFPFWVYTY